MTRGRLKDLSFLGWLLFAVILLITVRQSEDQTMRRDFVYFYSVGQILNHYTPEHLYELGVQKKTFDAVLLRKQGEYGPSPYPPYVAMCFRPMAMLSFWTAYRLWMSASMVLYLAGILLLIRRFFPSERTHRSLLCCFSLLCWSFMGNTLLSGQLSAVGFLAIACAICLEDMDHPYASGMALAVCAYKPTLLLLVLPMLVITQRMKTLCGFAVAVGALITITTIAEGTGIWLNYFHFSVEFAHLKNLDLSDYVDLAAISRTAGHYSPVLVWLVGVLAAVFIIVLLRIWSFANGCAQRIPSSLVWGTTMTWTLLLNVYVPLYDTILVVASIIITATALKSFKPRMFIATCFAILTCSYVARPIAEQTGIQIFSFLLLILGVLQMMLCLRLATRRISLHYESRPYPLSVEPREIIPILTGSKQA